MSSREDDGTAAPKPIGGASARKIFDRFDVDGSGSIDSNEMGRMLRSLKIEVTADELAVLMSDADPDQSGEIDFQEFVAVVNAQAAANAATGPAGAGGGAPVNLARVFQEAAKPINILKADVAEVLRSEGGTLQATIGEASAQAASELASAFERIGRRVGTLAETMEEALFEAHREETRVAAATAKLKLEATRTASSVALKNQMAELEALHHKQLEAKMAQLSEGGDALLHDAHAKVEELTAQLTELQAKHDAMDDLVKTTQKLEQNSERRATRAEAEASKVTAEMAAARASLTEAMASLSVKTAESKTLGEQVKDLLEGVNSAKATLSQALASLDIKESENKTLSERIAELVGAVDEAKASLDEALASLNVKLEENRTLEQQINELVAAAKRQPAPGESNPSGPACLSHAPGGSRMCPSRTRLVSRTRPSRMPLSHAPLSHAPLSQPCAPWLLRNASQLSVPLPNWHECLAHTCLLNAY